MLREAISVFASSTPNVIAMKNLPMFDYAVVNKQEQIDSVVSDIRAIITTEKLRVTPREYNL